MNKRQVTSQEKIWKLLTRLNHQLNDWDRYFLRHFDAELAKNGLWAHQDEALENIYFYHTSSGSVFVSPQEIDSNK